MCSVLLSYPFSVSLHLQPWWGWIRNPVPLQLRVQLVCSPAFHLSSLDSQAKTPKCAKTPKSLRVFAWQSPSPHLWIACCQ